MPVTYKRQLLDFSDDMATKIDIQFYSDARDTLLKAMYGRVMDNGKILNP
jgi:ATP-dependent Lon protease